MSSGYVSRTAASLDDGSSWPPRLKHFHLIGSTPGILRWFRFFPLPNPALRVSAQDSRAIPDGTASLVTAALNCSAALIGSSAALRIDPVSPTPSQFT
jgi:hypothetical protein